MTLINNFVPAIGNTFTILTGSAVGGTFSTVNGLSINFLNEDEVRQLRQSLAHLSRDGVRQFYECAFEDCRLVYNRLPNPRKTQTLVQVWKPLWKWR